MRRVLITLALLAVPVAAMAAQPNIVAVSVDNEAAVALDTTSFTHPSANVVEAAGFTVFGQSRGQAQVGYVLVGVYDFDCAHARMRGIREVLLDENDKQVTTITEPWTPVDLSAPSNHSKNVFIAACSTATLKREGGRTIDQLRSTYLRLLREGRFQ